VRNPEVLCRDKEDIVPEITLDFLPVQDDFFECEDLAQGFIGGLGYGKSRIASDKFLKYIHKYPLAGFCIASNSFTQLEAGTLRTFFERCNAWGLKEETDYVNRVRYDGTIRFPKLGAVIDVRTASNKASEKFRSMELDFVWVDEGHYWDEMDYLILEGRLRGKEASRLAYPGITQQIWVTANPPHTMDHWLVRLCLDPIERTGKPAMTLFQASTYDNYFLPPTYIQGLLDKMDPELAEIELGGKFGDLGRGKIWRRFNASKHVFSAKRCEDFGIPAIEYDPSLPIHWSHDFNIDPLCSVIWQKRILNVRGFQKEVMYVIDELRIRDAIIDAAVSEFKNRDAFRIARKVGLYLYGDPAGNQGNRQTGVSDWVTLRRGLHELGLNGQSLVENSHPTHRDRFNAGNGKFENGRGEIGVLFNPRCKYLRIDCERTYYKPGTSDQLVVKAEDGGTTTHLMDALSYAISKLWPITDVTSRPSLRVAQ
jgi:hypothetical protein